MLFDYQAIDKKGVRRNGEIDAISQDAAIRALQKKDLVVVSVEEQKQGSFFDNISIFGGVSNRELVIISQQIAILFESRVPALSIFTLLAAESENMNLRRALVQVSDDLQGGSSISNSLARHPKIFKSFYVNMVRSGEESGSLDKTFRYLADYMDRTYEVTNKARNALIYPAFVVATFLVVMLMMLAFVVPKISVILKDAGGELPIYTEIVIGLSDFFSQYIWFIILGLTLISGGFLWSLRTDRGRYSFDKFKLNIPFIGDLYRKLYLSRIADNMNAMVVSGVSMVRGLETTANVVDNLIYKEIIEKSLVDVQGGKLLSQAFEANGAGEMPSIMIQMVRVGEESGKLGDLLDTLGKFYRREVTNSVDTLVGLIEPIMIVLLGVGVSVLLASVLLPIYNLASTAGF
jgi:type IV pilus assembly protein PilC